VLHNSADANQRELAAEVIGYGAEKQAVVPDLVEAMRDPDAGVRNNAMRALWVIARYAQQHPEQQIKVPGQPFIDMLNSIEWTDRNKSSLALAELTQTRDPILLDELRKQALPSLIEMARWKAPGHAQPAFFILGRLDGLTDKEIGNDWDHDREAVISAKTK
jgi:HEAT repeat protein